MDQPRRADSLRFRIEAIDAALDRARPAVFVRLSRTQAIDLHREIGALLFDDEKHLHPENGSHR